MSAACKFSGVSLKELGWEACFKGTTKDLDKLLSKVQDPAARKEYSGLIGYKLFSHTWADGDMHKGYMLMSAACKFSGISFKELGWGAQVRGTTEDL